MLYGLDRVKGLTQKFTVQDGNLQYQRRIWLRKKTMDLKISEIPYIFIIYGFYRSLVSGQPSGLVTDGICGDKVPFIAVCKTFRSWLLDGIHNSGYLLSTHYKDEWLGVFLYKDIFATLLENGFQGEIYVWKDLYKDLHDDFVGFAWRGLLDLKKVHSIGDGSNKI